MLGLARRLLLLFMISNPPHTSPVASGARLLADVGGTNARFAWQSGPGAAIERVQVLPCAEHESLQAAIWTYLKHQALPVPSCAAVAIANPVAGDRVRMTNHHWSFSQAQVREEFGWTVFCVLNDFTALALALPHLRASDLLPVGNAVASIAAGPKALIGAGTGLGVSGLLPDAHGGWVAVQGEGGHVTLAAVTPRERQVVDHLALRYGHVSAERVLSGQGLVDVHAALCALDGGVPPQGLRPADVTALAALPGADHALPREAVALFCGWLGSVAGNLALTLGATGGVYIGGGVVPRLGPLFDVALFRQRFEDKGRFRAYLAAVPVWLITATPSPALTGAALALGG